jgi:hypothetical protein
LDSSKPLKFALNVSESIKTPVAEGVAVIAPADSIVAEIAASAIS